MDIAYNNFFKALRSALNYLYEPNQLRRSPLITLLDIPSRIDAPAALQKALLDAIEGLQPTSDDPGYARAWQVHDLLYFRYVRGYTREEVASKLGISDRQLSREQHAAIDALALALWQQHHLAAAAAAPPATPPAAVALHAAGGAETPPVEGAAVTAAGAQTWLADLPLDTPAACGRTFLAVLELLGPLMAQNDVRLRYAPDEAMASFAAAPNTLRQSLLIVLGWLIPLARNGQITLIPHVVGHELVVTTSILYPTQHTPEPFSADALPPGMSVLQQLVARAGGSQRLEATAGQLQVTFSLPGQAQVPVLMIDDNADTIRLFERALQETRYALVGLSNPAAIEQQIARYQPRLIILDVMMPEIDGWELLVRLRQYLDARRVAILICSILPLQELAHALGASGFLQKPVLPHDLVQVLDQQVARLSDEA